MTIDLLDGQGLAARRLVVRLHQATRDGDPEIAVLTNLPKDVAAGVPVAELYRDRWTLETRFQSLTMMLDGGLKALGHPRAAWFGFAVALAAYNALSTVQAALRATHGDASTCGRGRPGAAASPEPSWGGPRRWWEEEEAPRTPGEGHPLDPSRPGAAGDRRARVTAFSASTRSRRAAPGARQKNQSVAARPALPNRNCMKGR